VALWKIARAEGREAVNVRELRERMRRLWPEQAGQVLAEYSLLMWLVVLIGVASLVTFFFAFEEGVIGYYEDIVNIICLPIP